MRVNFIMNSTSDAHANKRIKEFASKGHDVKVFGFERDKNVKYNNDAIVIGHFSNALSYRKRISIYIKALRKLFKKHSGDDCIWYYQGLDVALFSLIFNHGKMYIYEECDLVHANVHNMLMRCLLEKVDKYIIKNAYRTIMTSEGFLDFHYGDADNAPKNIVIIPNKLSPEIMLINKVNTKPFNKREIKFAFVGGLRYHALVSIADIISRNYPNHEFHFYGFVSPNIPEKELPQRANVFYHGAYKSPEDLPAIYSNIDVLISTYDTKSANVRYAEPNKLYESLFFRRPIVVSANTFLADKVKRIGTGYVVDPFNENAVKDLVREIEETWQEKADNLNRINKQEVIDNDNEELIINKTSKI